MRPAIQRLRMHRWPTLRCSAVACLLLVAGPGLSDESPFALREKLLKEQAVEAMKLGDVNSLFDAMDQYRALEKDGAVVSPGLFFAEADLARSSGDPVRAERAFNDYFRVASPEGAAFAEAMRSYSEFRGSIPEATWSILETMTPVAGGTLHTGDEPRPVPVAPFSMARQAVTRGQFEAFVGATGYRRQDAGPQEGCPGSPADAPAPVVESDASAPVTCVSWQDAAAYVTWLSQSSGVRFRLPRATELEFAMVGAGSPTRAPDDRADDVEATDAAAPPLPAVPQPQGGGIAEEWTGDCAPESDATAAAPDPAAATPPCAARITVAIGRQDPGAASPGGGRENRDAGYAAADLGFRLALGR